MLIWLRSAIRNNRGQSMVELALLLPVVMLLVGGIIDFGRLYHEQMIVTAAAREGARVAAVDGEQLGETAAEKYARDASGNPDNVTANAVPKSENVATPQGTVTVKRVEMTVTNLIPVTFPVIAAIFGDQLDDSGRKLITGKATMRME
jgi:Flp pilus assembly protein TadG